MEQVSTPGKTTIEEVGGVLGVPPTRLIKTLDLHGSRWSAVIALVRGDRELNEAKLAKLLGGPSPLADAAVVKRVTGAPVGLLVQCT